MYEVISPRVVGAKVGDIVALDDAEAKRKTAAGLVRPAPKPAPKVPKKGDD